jgi:tol-pal system protein YbgF
MKKYHLLYIGLMLSFVSSAKAEDLYLREDINKLKEDLVMVQRQLYRDKTDATAPDASVSNIQVRLGEYDEFMRNINGKVENIEYRLSQIEKKLETFDKDIDLRFEQFKKQGVVTPMFTPNKPISKEAPKGVSAKELYEQALNDLKNEKNASAEEKFTQILTSFPNDALAGNAQYWLGEVYYKQQDFKKAAVAFKDGYSKYPNGAKGPDCLLKLGLSMKALDKKEEACTAFVNLPKVFDKINNDIATRAKKEAEALACK